MQAFDLASQEGKEQLSRALEYLRRPEYYPTAISLYGRLSYGKFKGSSYLITNQEDCANPPRIYAFLDRCRRPETEMWLFGEWEVNTDDSIDADVKTALHALFRTVKSLPVPSSVFQCSKEATVKPDDIEVDHSGLTKDDYMAHAKEDNIILCGAVHERTLPLLRSIGLLSPRFSHVEVPFLTYVFDNDHLPATAGLFPGLRWSRLLIEHMELINSRTNIQRQTATMAVIPSIGVFSSSGSNVPVAWGFIGVDGSLSTLHVEPEFRGRGLAKILTHKLLTDRMEAFFTGGAIRLGHGHVAHKNEASKRLCESVGGRASWSVHWARVDLSAEESH